MEDNKEGYNNCVAPASFEVGPQFPKNPLKRYRFKPIRQANPSSNQIALALVI